MMYVDVDNFKWEKISYENLSEALRESDEALPFSTALTPSIFKVPWIPFCRGYITPSATNSPSPDPDSNGPMLNKENDRSFFWHWLYEYPNENVKVTARKIKVQLLSPFLFGMFSISDKVGALAWHIHSDTHHTHTHSGKDLTLHTHTHTHTHTLWITF